MSKGFRYGVLVSGIAAFPAALFLYVVVYELLTRASHDREKDWLFRLSLSTAAMAVPFLVTLALALRDRRRGLASLSGKIGLVLAFLSLGLTARPIRDGVIRSRQSRNLALHDVPAPLFDTPDITGQPRRLGDYRGKVVLINIWATWCGPCRTEMPKLNALYEARKDQGLVVFGISDENENTQKQYLERVPVTYPLLTTEGQLPDLYRDIARYPALFLVDRSGKLQPAPNPDQPFEEVEAAVDSFLKQRPD